MPERRDEELATEDANGELVFSMPVNFWALVRLAGNDLAILVAAESGGVLAVDTIVQRVLRDHEHRRVHARTSACH